VQNGKSVTLFCWRFDVFRWRNNDNVTDWNEMTS